MYNVTTTFLEKIKENNRHIQPYVVIGNATLDYNRVCEFSIDSSYGDSLPSVGGVVASTLKLKLVRGTPTPEIFTTQDIKPYIKLETSTGVWESIPLGVYKPKIDSIKKTNLTIEIDCMDAIGYSGEIPYESALTYPTTTTKVLQEIQEQSGMSITIPSISATVKTAITGSCRQALAEVAELLSCNAVVDRTGSVVFRYLNNTNFTMDANNYMDFKLTAEDAITIGKLRCKKTGEDAVDLTCGYSGFELSFENDNVTTTAELQTIYNRIFPVTYYAYTLTCQGMPHLDVGDKISLTDNKGVTRNLYILSHKLTFNGGLKSEFAAAAPSKDSSGTGSTGNTITGNLKDLNIHKQVVEELIAGNITADNIKANSIDATRMVTGTITADSGIIANAAIGTAHIQDAAITNAKILDGTISNAKIGDAEITGAKIANATIGTAKIEQGAITTALIDTGAVGTAQIADGSITDAKIVSLTANKITAGTLDAGEINVVNLNADNITVGTINGQRIADGAITTEKIDDEAVDTSKIKKLAISTELLSADAVTADKIVSGAVTTDKLAAKSVTANKIASDAVTADKIAANAITADKIQAGAITVDKVSSNFGASLDLNSNVAITSKVSKGDVIAEINLSEENAKIAAGKIALEGFVSVNEKFSIDEAGYMIATGGTIAGFTINADSLSCSITEDYSWLTEADLTKVRGVILGTGTVTDEEFEKLDVDDSYHLGATDLLHIHEMLNGAEAKTINSKMTINLNSARDSIVLEGLTGFKTGWKTRIGVGGISTRTVKADTVVCGDSEMSDFVVEQGTEGIWTYKKWASGVAECWGEYTTTVSSWNGWGSIYESQGMYAEYPSELFIEVPQFMASISHGDFGGWIEVYNGASNTRTPVFYVLRPTNNVTGSVSIGMYVIGLWK